MADGHGCHAVPVYSPTPAQYEALVRDIFLQEYTPTGGDIIVDVGAGIGWELNLWSRLVGPSGHVYAVEADPTTFSCLSCRKQLNAISNVTLIHGAVADQEGEVVIGSDGLDETHHLVSDDRGHRVRAMTIDSLVNEHHLTRIDFLKMNIEGAEQRALGGMCQSIHLVRNIAVSCHDFLADRGGDDSTRTMSAVRGFLVKNHFHVIGRRPDDPRDWARGYIYGQQL